MALSKKKRLQDGPLLRISVGHTPKGRDVVQLVLKDPDAATRLPPVVVNEKKWMEMAEEIESAAAAIRSHFSPRLASAEYRCLEAIADLPEGQELSALSMLDVEDVKAEEREVFLP